MTASHEHRIRAASLSLEATTRGFVSFLEAMPETVATEPLAGGWTPAAHLWHVALTNNVFSGIVTGEGPITAAPGISDIPDEQWSFNAPPPVPSPDILLPPPDARPGAAVRRLLESIARLRPLIDSLDPATAQLTAQLPWARITVYQVVEWAGGHTLRHLAQVGRELHVSTLRAPIGV